MVRTAKQVAKRNRQQAVGYIRVSTDKQDLGPEAQRAAIEAWARARGVELLDVFEDRITSVADMEDRPGFTSALALLQSSEAGIILVAKRDRIARDTLLIAVTERKLQEQGIAIVSAAGEGTDGDADDPAAQLMRAIFDAFAQYERALIRARTKAALAVKKSQGVRLGSAPFGYRVSEDRRELVPHHGEQAAIARARELRGQGMKLEAIAETLNNEGAARRGARWHVSAVHTVLKREAVAA